jgi:hypothetical protein
MRSKIITSMKDGYRGWELYVSRGYENSSDLKVVISPGVKLDSAYIKSLSDKERIAVHHELLRKKEKYSYTVRVAPKETMLLFFKVVPWDHAKAEAIKYIDKNLGWFDLNKFHNGDYPTSSL